MPRVIHFEIHAGEPERAMAFYSNLFGWTFQKYPMAADYWTINTGPSTEPGINGGLLSRRAPNPKPGEAVPVVGFICTVDVADVDRTVAAALTAGGRVAFGKRAIPGLAWLAYLIDTEGNVLGVYQADKNAK